MEPAVSIVICTYNGADKLPYLFTALNAQSFTDFETIVVVDGSTDGTLQLLKDWAGRISSMEIIIQKNSGRSKVRNRGALSAKGKLLVFYDDDMVPQPDSIKRHMDMHAGGNSIIVSGNVFEEIEADKTDIQNYKAHLTERWVSKYADGVTQMDSNNLFFTAANCSVRKKVFDELGGFNEKLTDAEDFDFAKRAMANGIPVYFDKDNVAIHRDYITARSYVIRLRQYRAAHATRNQLSSISDNEKKDFILKRVVYWVFAGTFWIHAIDAEWLKILPRMIRYKIYDVIFHSLSVKYPDVKV